MRLIALLILTISAFFPGLAVSQEVPSRAGRVAHAEGTVALYQDPDQGWEKAYRNSPVTSENSIWTDPNSRAEVRVSGIALRLEETSQLDISRLDDLEIDAFLVRGSVGVRVRHFQNDQRLDFSTPHAAFRFYGLGRYRIDVDVDRDETLLTVFAGTASMRSGTGDIKVDAGRAIRVFGGSDPYFERETARTNAFDRWALARDEKWVESRSIRYVSPYMTGYEDLDRYGQWIEEPQYGALWYPTNVSRDWVPYRQGHWSWVRPWGWTWVADEPWGYAPYHYGRWVYVRDRWAWHPGRREARPVWAPALVAWVGGGNFSVRVGGAASPAVGWYPLAPWERYQPWYNANATYVNRINVVVRDGPPQNWRGGDGRRDGRDSRDGRDDWRTWNRERGATVVRRDTFIDRRPVQQAVINVSPEVLRQAPAASPNTMFTRDDVRRRATESRQQLRTPGSPPAVTAAPVTAGAPTQQPAAAAQQQLPIARREAGTNFRPNFERRTAAPAPAPAAAPQAGRPGTAAPTQGDNPLLRPRGGEGDRPQQGRAAREGQQQQERAAREAQQQQERAAREAQQQQQRAGQQQQQNAREQERAAREAQQQQQERAAREAQQQQQRAGQQQQQNAREQERAAREGQQQRQQQEQQQAAREQERRAREAQQSQERAARDAQQNQERAAREAQQQQRQQQEQQGAREQERKAREAQQNQERAAREAQQQQQQRAAQEQAQRQQQERAAREAAQQQERAAREAAQQQQRSAREQERAAREAAQQQRPAPAAPPPAAQPQPQAAPAPATAPAPRERGRGDKDKDKDKDKEKDKDGDKDDNERGRGKGRER